MFCQKILYKQFLIDVSPPPSPPKNGFLLVFVLASSHPPVTSSLSYNRYQLGRETTNTCFVFNPNEICLQKLCKCLQFLILIGYCHFSSTPPFMYNKMSVCPTSSSSFRNPKPQNISFCPGVFQSRNVRWHLIADLTQFKGLYSAPHHTLVYCVYYE